MSGIYSQEKKEEEEKKIIMYTHIEENGKANEEKC